MNPPSSDLVARLKSLFLFRSWSEEDLERISHFARVEIRKRNSILFLHGDACSDLLILARGRVQMFRTTSEGREVTLHVIAPGGLVGCAALFLGGSEFPASARIVSKEAELIRLRGGAFMEFLARRPDLSRKMIGALAGRLAELADRLENRNARPAAARLAAWLLDQPSRLESPAGKGAAQAKGPAAARVILIDGSKKSLASSLGMTPETFSRCLNQYARERLLRVEGRAIILLNPSGLSRQAGE